MTSTTPDGPLEPDEADATAVLPLVPQEPDERPTSAATSSAATSSASDTAPSATPSAARGVPLTKAAPHPKPTGTAPTPVHATADDAAPEDQPRRLRVATVVWGLMLTAVGIWIVAWASGARIDAQLALICLLAAGGVALLVGSIVSGARHSRR